MTHDRTPSWSDQTADPLAGAVWEKSTYSGTQGNCLEVARNLPGLVAVRDSNDPEAAKLMVRAEEWVKFLSQLARRSDQP